MRRCVLAKNHAPAIHSAFTMRRLIIPLLFPALASALTQEFFNEKFEYHWVDGEYVCTSHPNRKINHDLYAEESLAYVDGASLPGTRDIHARTTLTLRHGKMDGDYEATDLDLRLTRRLGDAIAVVGELGLTDVDAENAPRLRDVDRFGIRRIGVGLKCCVVEPKSSGWAVSVTGILGTTHLDPVSGLPSLGAYARGTVNCEYRLTERVTYFVNPGYGIVAARHTLTTGQNDKTPYLDPELTQGLAVKLGDRLSLGIENRMETKFVDLERFDGTAIYLGPSVRYAGRHAAITLAVMPQLWGKPNDPDHLDLTTHEKLEVRLRVAFAF